MSKSLSGLKKLKYDKEHEHELVMYENTRADSRLSAGLSGGRKNCEYENLRDI